MQFDATADGRPGQQVSVVDECTRECLGALLDLSIPGHRLIDELGRLTPHRGYPAVLHGDNDPELVGDAAADWAYGRVGQLFIPPGPALA